MNSDSAPHAPHFHGHEHTIDYLQLEFSVSWRHLGSLENKRLWLFIGFCIYVAILLLAGTWLVGRQTSLGITTAHFLLALATIAVAYACRNIARSERQATERYRNKINLLRRTMLEILNSPTLNAMQIEGNANALQITSNPPKELRIVDLFDRKRWNTALFMKIIYDIALFIGLFHMLVLSWITIAS